MAIALINGILPPYAASTYEHAHACATSRSFSDRVSRPCETSNDYSARHARPDEDVRRRHGTLAALAEQPRGWKPTHDPRDEELARLRRENERLQARLTTAETIIDVQKKVSQLLGLTDPVQ
jgi:hypothetical protein